MEIQPEKMTVQTKNEEGNNNDVQPKRNFSAFASLGLLDRFLAVWIFLAMAVGIILGNFVPSMSPALEKGTFVGVSVPIGKFLLPDTV
jgi:ACR3 family arsenite transporter